MRLLTKAEACRELSLSLSTLNRRIAAGEVPVRREPCGRRHRVYVMLDEDPPSVSQASQSELAVAQERIRGLEEQVAILQGQVDEERQSNAALLRELKAVQVSSAQNQRGPWWKLWQRSGGC